MDDRGARFILTDKGNFLGVYSNIAFIYRSSLKQDLSVYDELQRVIIVLGDYVCENVANGSFPVSSLTLHSQISRCTLGGVVNRTSMILDDQFSCYNGYFCSENSPR